MSRTCVVIPCYNEEKRLPTKEFISFFSSDKSIYYCFVNDGSRDRTLKVLLDLQKNRTERVMILDQKKNSGKAEATRQGILSAMDWKIFDFIGFFDADFSTPLKDVYLLLDEFKLHPELQMVFGSRILKLDSLIVRNTLRHYFGRIFITLVNLFILKLPIYDTQCGAKFFTSQIAKKIFNEPFYSSWFFDIEIFLRLVQQEGIQECFRIIKEIPLREWIEYGGSKLTLRTYLSVPIELMRIYYHYHIKKPLLNHQPKKK